MRAIVTHGIGTLFLVFGCALPFIAARNKQKPTVLESFAIALMIVSGIIDAYCLIQVLVFGQTLPLGRRENTWFGEVLTAAFGLPFPMLLISIMMRGRKLLKRV